MGWMALFCSIFSFLHWLSKYNVGLCILLLQFIQTAIPFAFHLCIVVAPLFSLLFLYDTQRITFFHRLQLAQLKTSSDVLHISCALSVVCIFVFFVLLYIYYFLPLSPSAASLLLLFISLPALVIFSWWCISTTHNQVKANHFNGCKQNLSVKS